MCETNSLNFYSKIICWLASTASTEARCTSLIMSSDRRNMMRAL